MPGILLREWFLPDPSLFILQSLLDFLASEDPEMRVLCMRRKNDPIRQVFYAAPQISPPTYVLSTDDRSLLGNEKIFLNNEIENFHCI